MKYIYSFFALILFLSACTSTKQIIEEKPKELKPVQKKLTLAKGFNENLNTFKADGEIEFNMPTLDNSADFEIRVAKSDSLSMTIYGPLGITVAKLYATPTHFIFLNSFNGELFEGVPSEENFRKIANIPLSFSDFVSILTSKLAYSNSEYLLDKSNEQSNLYLFKAKNFNDEVYASADNSKIFNIMRYEMNKTKVFDVKFENTIKQGNFIFAKLININFPSMNGKIKIEYDKIEANVTFKEPFAFKIPKSVKRQKLD